VISVTSLESHIVSIAYDRERLKDGKLPGQPEGREIARTAIDTDDLADQVACCTQDLDERTQRVQLALFRLLVEGAPVEPKRLAARTALSGSEVRALLGSWHGVDYDGDGRVVAFQGLSVVEAPHRLRVDDRTLYAWCAWDTLFLPELIGRPAEIESTCPTTGQLVSLRVGPEGPSGVSPPEAVLSFIEPGASFGEDTIGSFCRFVHFFASPQAAQAWTRRNRGSFVISVEQGFGIGRRTNAAQLGAALAEPAARVT
jgi:alkylmercury lyase